MNLLQHVLITYINENNFFNEISYIMAPDIIRLYTKDRKYTHFEYDSFSIKPSYFIFPNDLSLIDKDYCISHAFSGGVVLKSSLGGKTSMRTYELTNKDLFEMPFKSYQIHLKQDMAFDSFIRKIFNCKRKFSDKFYLNDGTMINGNELRIIISSLENYGVATLIKFIRDSLNVDINQEWVESNIMDRLRKDCNEEICNNSAKFLALNGEIMVDPHTFNIKLLNKNQSSFYKMELLKFYKSLNINMDAHLFM